MARTWICVALLGLAALFAAPAHADVDAPATAVVATTAEGSTLTAADAPTKNGDEQFVVTLRGTDATRKPFTASDVEHPPLWPDESAIADHTDFSDDLSTVHLVVGGAVEAEVATVELIYRSGQVLRMSTVPGAGYAGRHGGQLGFFAVEITLTVPHWGDRRALCLYDAAGTLPYAADDRRPTRTVSLLQRRV